MNDLNIFPEFEKLQDHPVEVADAGRKLRDVDRVCPDDKR